MFCRNSRLCIQRNTIRSESVHVVIDTYVYHLLIMHQRNYTHMFYAPSHLVCVQLSQVEKYVTFIALTYI